MFSYEYYMRMALQEAEIALENDEVPVGAIIVSNHKIIAKSYNNTEQLNDATAHAEMMAITAASNYLNSRYLKDCTLYVTLEPCIMCAGAIFWSQIGKIVFGAYDNKRGFSQYSQKIFPKKTDVVGGVLSNDCEALIKEFFQNIRK